MSVIRSFCYDQHQILSDIQQLHNNGHAFEVDLTYGSGAFWKNSTPPMWKFDIEPLTEDVTKSCSMNTPLVTNTVSSVVFDPPFLTYVRAAREGNGDMVMAKKYSGYWRYDELEAHYKGTIKECARIVRKKGLLVFKCQDIVHNHKLHCTHVNVVNWAAEWFRVKDLFVLPAKHRMPSPNRKGMQKHARVFHSYFIVFERL